MPGGPGGGGRGRGDGDFGRGGFGGGGDGGRWPDDQDPGDHRPDDQWPGARGGPFDRGGDDRWDEPAAGDGRRFGWGFEGDSGLLRVIGVIVGLAVVIAVLVLPPISILDDGDGGGDSGLGIQTSARDDLPPLPDGLVALSALYDLSVPAGVTGPVALTVRLQTEPETQANLGFYSFDGGQWTRLGAVTPTAGTATHYRGVRQTPRSANKRAPISVLPVEDFLRWGPAKENIFMTIPCPLPCPLPSSRRAGRRSRVRSAHVAAPIAAVAVSTGLLGSGLAAERIMIDDVLHVRSGAAPEQGVETVRLEERWRVGGEEGDLLLGLQLTLGVPL